jgi:patatin-like phospholipase/acyl hydrolase
MSNKFRILTLDGGGIRGVYTAHILKRIQEDEGIVFSEYFDLIAGTSTGAILAGALATDQDINKVIQLYRQHGAQIFSSNICPLKKYLGISLPGIPCLNIGLFSSKYSQKVLREQLEAIFDTTTMSQTNTNLMLFSTDISNGIPHVFKSPYCEDFTRDRNIKLSDAILASTAAPVYFNPIKVGEYLLADGGIWCNNPSICAVAEAKNYFDKNHHDLRLLSIGTIEGKSFIPMKRNNHIIKKHLWGLLGWQTKVIDLTLNLQSIASKNTTKFLDLNSYLRINSKESKAIPMDDVTMIDDYISMADKEYTYNRDKIIKFFKGDRL